MDLVMTSTEPAARTSRPHRLGTGRRRLVAAASALALVGGLAACGDDDDAAEVGQDVVEGRPDGPDARGLLGLDVTAEGDVEEWLATNAFRLDKDGVGTTVDTEDLTDALEDEATTEDLATEEDDIYVEGTDRQAALVIVPRADLDVRAGDPVRVTGTIRALDADAIEELYDVSIDADADPEEASVEQLVIVAESVQLLE